MKKALIAMSGGVDSSAAAVIMKSAGYDCAGASMLLCGEPDKDAAAVCEKLGIPFFELDLRREFRENVIEKFIASYEAGETPNPCLECNKAMKFGILYKKAVELGFDFLVTGHYARTEFDESAGAFRLKTARDLSKDQSYVLYSLKREQLSRVKFPLGELSGKEEARELARKHGLETAKKRDSQDICFVPDKDYAGFIENYTKKTPESGELVYVDGKKLGEHKGLLRYTVGQRKGLGIAFSEPLYVVKKLACENKIILGTEKELYAERLAVRELNLINKDVLLDGELEAEVKTRYRAAGAEAVVRLLPENRAEIRFKKPQRAVCPGQSAVIYIGSEVIGGGIIE